MREKGGEINDEASHHLRTRAPRSSGTCGGCCRGALGHDVSVQRDRGAVASGWAGGETPPPESWASSASATSIEDSVPADSQEDLTAADSVAVSTVAAVSTAVVGTGAEATGEKCTGRDTMNPWRPLVIAMAFLLGAALEIAWQAGPAPAAENVPSV